MNLANIYWIDCQWSRIVASGVQVKGNRGPSSGSPAGCQGIIYWYRCGAARRDLQSESCRGQTVWKSRYRFASDGNVGLDLYQASGRVGRRKEDRLARFGGLDHQLAHQRGTTFPHHGGTRFARNFFSTSGPCHRPSWIASLEIHYACDGRGSPLAMIVGRGGR
jgi:hypothetical protein